MSVRSGIVRRTQRQRVGGGHGKHCGFRIHRSNPYRCWSGCRRRPLSPRSGCGSSYLSSRVRPRRAKALRRLCFCDPPNPPMYVGRAATLNACKSLAKELGNRSRRTASDLKFAYLRLHKPDAGDDGGSPTSEHLTQPAAHCVRPQFIKRVWTFAHLDSGLRRECDERFARYSRKNRPQRRGQDRSVIEDDEYVHTTEFLQPLALGGVEKEDLIASVMVSFSLWVRQWRSAAPREEGERWGKRSTVARLQCRSFNASASVPITRAVAARGRRIRLAAAQKFPGTCPAALELR